ncbi:MAG: TIGR03503 family protein [Aestuariibacter sp.]
MAQNKKNEPVIIDDTPLKELGDRYYNSIKLLQNRFRIDYKVDELTMVFFREFGSQPVVLVRPDGSKIFVKEPGKADVEWYDAPTFDMIKIFNPMPGPWQAVGQILPGSKVMVISDIQLETKPLPDIIFSGEILKQTAYLTNAGEPINYNEFRDVVELAMEFHSTNNPNYENFGAQSELIAIFEDNGKGMDEAPLDGTFTGQFNLRIAPGEWKPIFTVKTPMFTREREAKNVILLKNPITIDHVLDEGNEKGHHLLVVDAERDKVDIRSLLIDGKVRFPNGDVQNFSITQVSNDARTHEIINYEYGVFRVKLTAYGNIVEGRDFILDVPEYTFVFEEPVVEQAQELTALPDDVLSAEALALKELRDQHLNKAPEEEGMTRATIIRIIIIVNFLVILAGVIIWYTMFREKPENEPESSVMKLFRMVKGMIAGKKKDKKEEKEDDSDVIDLSMPE